MEGEILRFRLYKILRGPVQHAFVYVFYKTYAQTSSVYEFALQQPDHFTEEELLCIQFEKNVRRHSIPLLFSIIKASCNPPLAPPDSTAWVENGVKVMDAELPLEAMLIKFLKLYEDAAKLSKPLAMEEFNSITADIELLLERLLEGAGKFDKTGRWREDLDKMLCLLKDIKEGENFSKDDIPDDIKTELHMSYHLYDPKGLNPLFLKLIHVPESGQLVRKKKRRRDPEVKFQVANLIKTFPSAESKSPKRLCLVNGNPGSGKSDLGFLLGAFWSKRNGQIAQIDDYEAVILLSGLSPVDEEEEEAGFMSSLFPLCSLIHGADVIREWLLSARVLFVVDDAEELTGSYTQELCNILKESHKAHAVMLTSPLGFKALHTKCKEYVGTRLKLCGYERQQIIKSLDSVMRCMKIDDYKPLKEFLTTNICRLEKVLKYPVSLLEVCKAWVDMPDIYEDDVTTCTDLLWAVTTWKLEKALQCSLEIDVQSKIKEWLLVAGSKALESIKDDDWLERSYLKELEAETVKIFTSVPSGNIMSFVFKRRYVQRRSFCEEFSALHKTQQEFLAAWYAAHQVIDGKKLKVILGGVKCPYHMAVFMAGFIPKIQIFKWISGMHERRLISAAMNHAEGSNEDLDFNLDVVAEVKGLIRLVEFIVDICEYPDEWNIDAGDAQVIPIETLLFMVAPTRIFLNVEELKPYSELQKVIAFLCRVVIFAWLDSGCQFQYGNGNKMDHVARLFFSEHTKTRIDLVKGCMSNKVLKEITTKEAFSHLVFLKLRVLDWKNFVTVVKVSKILPKILWLEIKFDFPVLEEDITTVPKTTVPLLDVHLRAIDNASVSKLANLLGGLHDSYAGIHLEETSLTPEGVFVMLKQIHKRKIHMHSPPEHREKFRRWYYPQLSNFDKNTVLTDELAMKILGFDDRIYYSNHCVMSSCFALALDSWNLASYLEEDEEIIQFTYKTENLTCIKGLNGSVNIMVDGEHQVRKTKTSENSLNSDQ